jgi:hypothetical protein
MAYPVTAEEVIDIAEAERAKLETLSTRQWDFIFVMVDKLVGQTKFGDLYKEGFTYLAAHAAVMMVTRAAGEGTLSGESLGEFSQSFTMAVNNPTPDKNILSTIYGRQYTEIRDTVVGPFFIV